MTGEEAYWAGLGPEDCEADPRDRTRDLMRDINEYANFTCRMWVSGNETVDNVDNPNIRSLAIMSLGAAGETGEVVELVKKYIRDGRLDMDNLKKELGDMVYYWARLCKYFNLEPSEVLAANVEKLESRRARGKIRGSGDNR